MLRCGKDNVRRGDQRRSPSWWCFAREIIVDQTSNWKGFKLTNFEFRSLFEAIEATADNVFRDTCRFLGCFEHDDVAGHDLPNLVGSIRRTGLMKQLFFSDSGKRSLLTWSR